MHQNLSRGLVWIIAIFFPLVVYSAVAQVTASAQSNTATSPAAPVSGQQQISKPGETNSKTGREKATGQEEKTAERKKKPTKPAKTGEQQPPAQQSSTPTLYLYNLRAPLGSSNPAPSDIATGKKDDDDLQLDGNILTNSSETNTYLVNGNLLSPGKNLTLGAYTTASVASRLLNGSGCIAGKSLSTGLGIGADPPASKLSNGGSPRENSISVSKPKAVDPQFLKQKFTQTSQALAGLNPWNATALTNQYGALQGSTNSNSFVSAQLTTAGQPQTQTTYATGQPSTVVSNYTANCPTGYVVTGITAGNGVTCTAATSSNTPGQATLGVSQVTTPTPSLQTQISAPAFAGAIPAQPTATGALSPPSNIGLSPVNVLTQEVELNSELLTYQTLYNGLASDNLQISSNGAVGGARRQVTLAFPITVNPYTPYPGAVAEVRIFMLPAKGVAVRGAKSKSLTGAILTAPPNLSVVNLLPASNTYNVAQATTSTNQFGAGVTFDLIGVGVNAGKTKSTLYLAKDTDTMALQYSNPAEDPDKDEKKPLISTFRELLPTGECAATSRDAWTKEAKLQIETEPYDTKNAIIFGWQFKPVLGNRDITAIDRLFYAQVALDNNALAPVIFVETRWRQYNRKTGVVGAVYKDSCSWEYLGTASPLHYQAEVAYVTTDDLGGSAVRVVAHGRFTDPNFQVRMGNAQRAPDAINTSLTAFEYYTTASALVGSPTFDVLSEGNDPVPVVTIATGADCQMNTVTAHATPFADGTAIVTVDLAYGKDRTLPDESPLVLAGGTVYGLRDHPFLSTDPSAVATTSRMQFIEQMDALTTNPVVAVKDVNWSESSLVARVSIGPTFSALQELPTDPAGTPDGTRLSSGTSVWTSAGTNPGGGANASASGRPVPLKIGLYELKGTGLRSFCKRDGTCDLTSLTYINSSNGTAATFKANQVVIINDRTARLAIDQDMTKAVPNWPLVLEWTDPVVGVKSDWSLSTKVSAPTRTTITADKQPKCHDSLSVTFSGQDFSGVTNVAFETTNLNVLAKDTKSITVLVTTGVTATLGTKDLIATGADGKPIILPLTVVSR
jgi:hypothetical protein